MGIINILLNKQTTDVVKLKNVKNLVIRARKKYDNLWVGTEEFIVQTTVGGKPFEDLKNNSKVAVLLREAMDIKKQYLEIIENPLTNRKEEQLRLIATNQVLSNLLVDSGNPSLL